MGQRKRLVVARENKVNEVGHPWVLRRGALWIHEGETLPVYWGGFEEKMFGFAQQLERDGDEVTMEIEIFEDMAKYVDLESKIFEFAAMNYGDDAVTINDVITIRRSKIQQISIFVSPGFC